MASGLPLFKPTFLRNSDAEILLRKLGFVEFSGQLGDHGFLGLAFEPLPTMRALRPDRVVMLQFDGVLRFLLVPPLDGSLQEIEIQLYGNAKVFPPDTDAEHT